MNFYEYAKSLNAENNEHINKLLDTLYQLEGDPTPMLVSIAGMKYYKETKAYADLEALSCTTSMAVPSLIKMMDVSVTTPKQEFAATNEYNQILKSVEQNIQLSSFRDLQPTDQFFYPEHWLTLKRNPKNEYDKNAIQVHYKGKQIGHVPRDVAQLLVQSYTTDEIESAVGLVYTVVGNSGYFYLCFPKKNRKVEAPKATTNVEIIKPVDTIMYTVTVTPKGINYQDYTGFLRTLMEYATFAHR